jgi:NSS family neurotransmitter:Na+ symporter
MIFPAVFALGQEPNAGPDLIFRVLPAVFGEMVGGTAVGAVFFFLLAVAALTSTVSLLEVVAAYFIDERGWSRTATVWAAGAVTVLVGLPSALSWVSADKEFFGWMDLLWVNLSLPFGALMLCLFATFVWGLRNASDEITSSSPEFRWMAPTWRFFVRVVCPIFIALILLTRFVPVDRLLRLLGGGT